MSKTIEQLCRDIIDIAISEELVVLDMEHCLVTEAQDLSSGDLGGLANFVNDEINALETHDQPSSENDPKLNGWQVIAGNDDLPQGMGRPVNILVDLNDKELNELIGAEHTDSPIVWTAFWDFNKQAFLWHDESDENIEHEIKLGNALNRRVFKSARVIAWQELPSKISFKMVAKVCESKIKARS